MFGTIRRHQKWLWLVIVTLTVISFVYYFNPSARNAADRGAGTFNLGSISGEPVSVQDFRQAQAEVFIHYFLSHGEWPDKDATAKQMGFDAERETYFRLFFISKFKENNIHVSAQAVGQQAADVFRGMGRNGSAVTPEQFEQQVLQPHGFTLGDFQRYLHNQLALFQLISVVGMSGRLVTADEAKSLYLIEQQEISSEAVFISPSNYLASVSVTSADVKQFFTNQMAHYRLPERVQVSYVKFNVSNYLADADAQIAKLTNFDKSVDALYLQRGTNYYSEAKTPEEAKAKIKEEIHHDFALRAARNKAAAFAEELMSRTPVQVANLETLATEKGFTVATTAPFDAKTGPAELEVLPSFARTAFMLTADEPFGGPVPAANDVFVLALKKRLPSEIPPLDSLRDKVQADVRFVQAAQIAYVAGTNFAQSVATGLAAGKTFSALSAEAKLPVTKISPFSLATSKPIPEIENHVTLGRLQDVAFGIPVGQASGYIPTEDGGGFVLHITSCSPGDVSKTMGEFPAFLARVRQTRQGEAFNAWFGREADRALRDTPLARKKQP